jgi:S-DNA-T family DNA segregation ATPase FtsK/SpoIIIE
MLSWSPVDGSLALIGSIGSGTTSTLIALAAASCSTCSPTNRHLYVLDARGDDGLGALASLAHCGGVVRLTEGERVHRLLARVVAIIDRRLGSSAVVAANDPEIVLMIDGYGSLRSSLSSVDRQQTFDLLQRVVNDGPAGGVALVVADDGGTAVTMLPVTHRWIFHLDDPGSATSMGLRAVPVAADRPGRLRVLASGREAQVVHGAPGLAALPGRDDRVPGAAEEIGVLEESIAADSIDVSQLARPSSGAQLLVGVAADDLRATAIEVADGDHLLVVGGPRSGVSTAVARLATAWEADARRRGGSYRVMHVARRCPVDPHCVDDASARIAIVIDDAHRVDDPGLLAAIATGDHPHITVIAGARADVVRTAYGHWTREIAKSRCGLVMSSRGDPDGDLLGVQVPRRPLVATRPGLGWVVDGGPLRQVQVATD